MRQEDSILSPSNAIKRIVFCFSLLIFFTPQLLMANDSIEISSSNDFEAPEIKHDLANDVTRDKKGNVIIRAIVTDEFSINSVSLFFRNSENKKYRKRKMLPDTEKGNDVYKASLPKSALAGDRIEYYFEADDKVGNKKLKGLEFSPLKRVISDIAIVSSINGNSIDLSKKVSDEPPNKMGAENTDVFSEPMIWMPGL